jgi:hypothetical protein
VSNGSLEPEQLRHAIALHLGIRSITRAADYRALRSHAAALHPVAAGGSSRALELLTTFYGSMIGWSVGSADGRLADTVEGDAPASALTPALRHNAIIAAARKKRGHRRFTKAQIQQLEALGGDVPEAWWNLAVEAESRDNHAAALGYLKKITAGALRRDVAEWIRWKELAHGAP